ncbi:hypothetical protein ACNHKD_03915 [Methylocystis sp. JAN1]|uniref:hypothetical protein n=1 Tax=Methylocystis sp. JAN1 TaxID=3397211 RepID=UPI003FA330AB
MPTRRTIRFFRAPLFALALGAAPVCAQTMQGDWPCRQVRVPEIALGGVWTGPSIEQERKSWRDDAAVADLVARIAPRRTPQEEAEKLIADFAKGAGANRKARLTLLFSGLYERLNGERLDIVNGLDRFGRRLKEMAEKTREETQAFYELQNRKPPEPEAVKKAAEALQWRVRLFEEQRKMVSYVCESPALIEQRLGALARKIIAEME